MEFKTVSIGEFKKILEKSTAPVLGVFFGTWCPYCRVNIPEIITHFNTIEKNYNAYLIHVEENENVWSEDNNTEWALNVVPTFRIYDKNKVVWQHEKEIKPKKLENIIKTYL